MLNFDWSRFVVRITVNASPKDLYKSWATKKGMELWFLRLSEYKKPDGSLRAANEYVEKGDTYRWLWHGWPDDMEETGSILDATGRIRSNSNLVKQAIVLYKLKMNREKILLNSSRKIFRQMKKG